MENCVPQVESDAAPTHGHAAGLGDCDQRVVLPDLSEIFEVFERRKRLDRVLVVDLVERQTTVLEEFPRTLLVLEVLREQQASFFRLTEPV